jgi:hypothetical protein
MRFFFVMALGRSGTNFLASLLARDGRGRVLHEPYPLDSSLLVLRYAGGFDGVVDHLLEERFKELLPDPERNAFYGEVNSYLRYEVDWLRARFDPALIHLVRDGRDFVRSAYIRGVYTPLEPSGPIVPKDGEPHAGQWPRMTRFQRLCWYWMHTNEFLASRIYSFVRFEDLLRDYGIFKANILDPTGVQVSREVWRREVERPKNTSRAFRLRSRLVGLLRGRRRIPDLRPLPPWSKWDDERAGQFWEICGPTMRRFGYRE